MSCPARSVSLRFLSGALIVPASMCGGARHRVEPDAGGLFTTLREMGPTWNLLRMNGTEGGEARGDLRATVFRPI